MANGTKEAHERLKRVLYNATAMCVLRHDDADYQKALDWAEEFGIKC